MEDGRDGVPRSAIEAADLVVDNMAVVCVRGVEQDDRKRRSGEGGAGTLGAGGG